ncbi:GNAT family N-acetyltransferase [Halobacillus salinarum]|uniref:GNAT family N-acetyltransferase n=1 Tax=Halobacillus salinarum TaxID=2932257 RepID=A0ABY4ENR3_9BACI|nr:GNAT family N-acetyltransferase [Halobacillus salinarum]UOQ45299.1 GNAT family N-acetyltransferase [Halobacillus salinarum]
MKWDTIPVLTTENYQLRGLNICDAQELLAFMGDKETMKFITPHPVETLEDMNEYIEQRIHQFYGEKEIPWVIMDQEKVIGFFRLHKLHFWHRKAEMGAIIHPDHQNKGVMSEVFACILPFVFEDLELNRLVGDIFSGNAHSRRLLEKYGFKEEGRFRETDFDGSEFHDTVVFSLLKQEFSALNKRLIKEGKS